MEYTHIDREDIQKTLKEAHNWKAAGPDSIPNFWWKQLYAIHNHLAVQFNQMIENHQLIPNWMAEGRTVLIPKTNNTNDPKNYRPITCLNTMYKLLTGILARKMSEFISSNNLMPIEQKGCCKGSYGCKDQLLYSKTVIEDCKKHKKKLCIAWIDYRKAFDSVPHSWLLESMRLMGIAEEIITFCAAIIPTWETSLQLVTADEIIKTEKNTNTQRHISGGYPLTLVILYRYGPSQHFTQTVSSRI